MFSSKNIVKYLLFLVFSQFLMVDFSFANPIPVFCLAGWVDKCTNIRTIIEYEYAGSPLKTYSITSGNIIEYEYAGSPLKTYSLF